MSTETKSTKVSPAYVKAFDSVGIDEFERVLRRACEDTGVNESAVLQKIGLTPTAIYSMRKNKRARRVTYMAVKGLLAENGRIPTGSLSDLTFEECLEVVRRIKAVQNPNAVLLAARGKLAHLLALAA